MKAVGGQANGAGTQRTRARPPTRHATVTVPMRHTTVTVPMRHTTVTVPMRHTTVTVMPFAPFSVPCRAEV